MPCLLNELSFKSTSVFYGFAFEKALMIWYLWKDHTCCWCKWWYPSNTREIHSAAPTSYRQVIRDTVILFNKLFHLLSFQDCGHKQYASM